MKRLQKLFNIDIKSVDEENRRLTFCFSDDQEDREGEIVDQASWDVKNYMLNPIILFGHDPSAPENVLGQGVSLDLNNNGKSYITAQFDDAETNPKADMVFRQLIKRTLRSVSAGFITHTYELENDVPVLKDNELIEVSIVPIPANPRAIALGLREGSISRKDGQWLLETMNKEAKYIEEQLKKGATLDGVNEKDMEETNAVITQLTGLVAKLAESQAELVTTVAKLVPPEETAEQKTAREAQEAADKAAADQKAIDDKAEADRIALETANGGGDDQSGAGDDAVIDPKAELTPELQAQIDEELAALLEDGDE